jgi:hypothetical protein
MAPSPVRKVAVAVREGVVSAQCSCDGQLQEWKKLARHDQLKKLRAVCPMTGPGALLAGVVMGLLLSEQNPEDATSTPGPNSRKKEQTHRNPSRGGALRIKLELAASRSAPSTAPQPATLPAATPAPVAAEPGGRAPPPPPPLPAATEGEAVNPNLTLLKQLVGEEQEHVQEAFRLLPQESLDRLLTVSAWLLCPICVDYAIPLYRERNSNMDCGRTGFAALWAAYWQWSGDIRELCGLDGKIINWNRKPVEQQGDEATFKTSFRDLVQLTQANMNYKLLLLCQTQEKAVVDRPHVVTQTDGQPEIGPQKRSKTEVESADELQRLQDENTALQERVKDAEAARDATLKTLSELNEIANPAKRNPNEITQILTRMRRVLKRPLPS